jgi:amino acid transporter
VLGLLHVCYTITGFDASGHTSEETRDAQRSVPKGMITSVFWSGLFGWVLVVAILLAMPSVDEGAAKGWSVFAYTLDASGMPGWLKDAIAIGIVLSNYLCALAGMTSLSRMIYAFSRDGGIPGVSKYLRRVSPKYRTPGTAIFAGAWALLHPRLGLRPGRQRLHHPGLGLRGLPLCLLHHADRRGRARRGQEPGPRRDRSILGGASKLVGVLAVLGGAVLAFVGFQPPYQLVGEFLAGAIVLLIVVWFAFESDRLRRSRR